MRTSDIFFGLAVVLLAFATSSVKSEYSWNGAEWVWQEDNNIQEAETRDAIGEGSGGGEDSFYDESDDDTDYDAASGDYDPDEESRDNLNNYNNNHRDYQTPDQTYTEKKQQPYEDPNYKNPYVDSNQFSRDNSQINNNPTLEATPQPPYFGVEEEETDGGIYVEGPTQKKPTAVDQDVKSDSNSRDPSISSQPKNGVPRPTSFFAQPGTLAAVIGGAVVGLLCAILCVMFVVYRMRKKDEGSYALDEPKRSPTVNAYAKHPSREFYA